MTDGPTEREIQRVREAMDRHDSELREDEETSDEDDDEGAEDGKEDG